MIFREKDCFSISFDRLQIEMHTLWVEVARKIAIDYGMLIHTCYEIENDGSFHIWFKAMGHHFECANDLRKALDNKTFM